MGQMRFRVHDRQRLAPDALNRIYVAGLEDIPWATRAQWDGDELVVARQVDDSGSVFVPWDIEGVGRQILATATLMERDKPYTLEVELARGLIQRLRARLFIWEWTGVATPDELSAKLAVATQQFARAATNQQDLAVASAAAQDAICSALAVSEALVDNFTQQSLSARRSQSQISTLMGVSLANTLPDVETRRQLVEGSNIIQLPVAWRAIEAQEGRRDFQTTDEQLAWCQTAGLKAAAGPLLRMDDLGVPDWMVLWEGEFESLSRLMMDHVRAVVERYAGRVHLWHVASRVNTGDLLSLNEEHRLNLVALAVETVRRIDPRTPTVVSFDQPWAEYLVHQDTDLAPLHYADALVRADLGVAGFGLEINAGCWPGGGAHRPVFEYGRMIDQWALLGLPLMVLLATPNQDGADTRASAKSAVELITGPEHHDDPQAHWTETVIPLLLSRNAVQVVLWNQLSDSEPHEFAHAGLFDDQGKAKPALESIRRLRKKFLA